MISLELLQCEVQHENLGALKGYAIPCLRRHTTIVLRSEYIICTKIQNKPHGIRDLKISPLFIRLAWVTLLFDRDG